MPEMDGYELLKIVNKRLKIPVILMSVDARIEVVIKGIQEGACYVLHKPISINLARNLWIHVVWKKFSDDKEIKRSHSKSDKGKAPLVFDSPTPVDRATNKGIRIDDGSSKGKRKQVQEEEEEDDDDPATPKKPRIIWTPELNKKFEEVIQQLGIDEAIPSKIAELMNVEGLDRHHVGSHLQKYRIRQRQEKERQQSYLYWNQFLRAMNPSYRAEYMGMGPNNISGSSSNPVLVPQAATYPAWVSVPGTGNAILRSFSGSAQPQQVGGSAQQYYNANCLPKTAFGATDVGITAGTFSANPTASFNNNNNPQAPGTSTPGCHAAGGSAPSGLLMGSNQSLPTIMEQENLGVHEAAGSSRPVDDDEIDEIVGEFFKEGGW